jgi:hypothetical protein
MLLKNSYSPHDDFSHISEVVSVMMMMMMRMTSSPRGKVPPPAQAAIINRPLFAPKHCRKHAKLLFPMLLRPISFGATPIKQPFDPN